MRTYNIHEAKTNLSRLIDEVEHGESFIIAKAGKPKAQVIPIRRLKKKAMQRIGFMKGMYTIPDNYEKLTRNWIKKSRNCFTERV